MKTKLLFILLALCTAIFSQAQTGWSVLQSGTTTSLYGVDFLNENIGIAVGDSGTILQTADAGLTWERLNSGVSKRLNAVSFIDSLNIVAVGDSTLILTTSDGGNSWSPQYVSGITNADLLSVDMSPSGKGIIGGQYMTLITTTDAFKSRLLIRKNYFGTFWSAKILDDDNAFVFGTNSIWQSIIYKVAHFDSLSSARFYLLFNGKAWATSTALDGYPFNNDSVITAGFLFGNNGAGLSSYITRDQSWETEYWYPVYSIDSSWYNAIDFSNNYGVAVGGRIETDKYFSAVLTESYDQGKTWSEVPCPITEFYLNDVKLINKKGYIVGDRGLIMKSERDLGFSLPGIDYQVNIYPNPASETCRIAFTIPDNSNATLALYSMSGTLIRTIPKGNLNAGRHAFTLPVLDLQSGIYYCMLMLGKQRVTRKICIVK